jgi:beta-lactamase regulating signal transducer with metallopeptidase domain
MNLTSILGWTLLHFLWQGTLIALLLATLYGSLRNAAARTRYALGCAAMLLMLLCVAGTFARMYVSDRQSSSVIPALSSGRVSAVPASANAATQESQPTAAAVPSFFRFQNGMFSALLPWLAYFWMAGVCVLAVRSLGGWVILQRFKRQNALPAEVAWQQRMTKLAERLKISRAIRLCESAIAEVPAVIGWVRPIVLLPASALSGLTPEQLEALLAHELAHIRRHDYLLNLFQTCVETLLFYHPAVWWVGKRIRIERENCCDDLAVQICGDPLTYARALTQMDQLRCEAPRLAMAANRGPLLERIQRLLARPQAGRSSAGWIAGAAVVLIVVSAWASPRLLSSHTVTFQQQDDSGTAAITSATPAKPSPREVASTAVEEQHPHAAQSPATTESSAQESQPEPGPQQPSQEAQSKGSGFIDDMNKAGYRNLTADQLIALKIQGVDGAYVRGVREEGYQPTVDQLLAMRIHGVTPQYIDQFKERGWKLTIDRLLAFRIHGVDPKQLDGMDKAGYKMNPDQAIAMRIHGLTPELASNVAAMGLGKPTFDQLLAMRIHGIDAQFLSGMKEAGVRGLNLDNLLALKIHGADPAQIKEMAVLGYKDLSADQVVTARIHGVTPEFIREVQNHGFKNLTLDQIIKLKQYGILDKGTI